MGATYDPDMIAAGGTGYYDPMMDPYYMGGASTTYPRSLEEQKRRLAGNKYVMRIQLKMERHKYADKIADVLNNMKDDFKEKFKEEVGGVFFFF